MARFSRAGAAGVASCVLLVWPGQAHGRLIPEWRYAKLSGESTLIVIAQARSRGHRQ
jgi:hypothetical protein